MQPRQILDTSMPVDPSLTYCIAFLPVGAVGRTVLWAAVSSVMGSAGYRRLLYSSSAVVFGVMARRSGVGGWPRTSPAAMPGSAV